MQLLTDEQKAEIQREVASRLLELLQSDLIVTGVRDLSGQSHPDIRLKTTRVAFEDGEDVIYGVKPAGPQATEPEHLEPLVRVIARAIEVLGTSRKALRWLNTPIRSLGDQTPTSLLNSPEGIERVEDALGRIEHGVW